PLVELNIVGGDRTPLPRGDDLRGVETEPTELGGTPRLPTLVGGAYRLGCVFDDTDRVAPCHLLNLVEVRRVTVKVNRNYRLRLPRDRLLYLRRVAVVVLLDLYKDWLGVDGDYHVRRGDDRTGR